MENNLEILAAKIWADCHDGKLIEDVENHLSNLVLKLAHEYAAWAWGKIIPTEVTEVELFFQRFLNESGYN